MSCLPQLTRAETSGSSDYGSDFTPDEEELLNELLCKAVAEHATAATPTSTAAVPTIEHEDTIAATADLESLQPAVIDALVADIEDGLEEPSGSLRLPKVLGREKPRSPWRQASQRSPFGPGVQAGAGVWCASPGAGNRSSPSGMRCSIFPWRFGIGVLSHRESSRLT